MVVLARKVLDHFLTNRYLVMTHLYKKRATVMVDCRPIGRLLRKRTLNQALCTGIDPAAAGSEQEVKGSSADVTALVSEQGFLTG